METVEDELTQIDHAFSGNQLLASMPKEARALLEPFGTLVELKADSELHPRGAPVVASFFPYGSTMISSVVELSPGRSIEVASVGSERAVGGIVSCGHAPAFAEARV